MAIINLGEGMSYRVLNGFVDKHGCIQPLGSEVKVEIELITTEEYLNLKANGQLHRDDRSTS